MSSSRKRNHCNGPENNHVNHAEGRESADASTAVLPPPPVDRDDLTWYVRHHLTDQERLVIMLRYAEELEFDEIAGVLRLPQDEIERIHRSVVGRLNETVAQWQSHCLAGAF